MSDAEEDTFESVNPYAPSQQPPMGQQPFESDVASRRLGTAYWFTFACLLVGLAVLTPWLPGLTIPAMIALILAAIRVPIIQKRVLLREPHKRLPYSLVMLLTSAGIVLMIEAAAAATFMAICIPGGFLLFTVAGAGGNEGLIIASLFGGSILAAMVVFFFIYNLSLKLPF